MHYVAKHGLDADMRYLLCKHAHYDNDPDIDGTTPLHIAANAGHEKTVQALLDFCANTENQHNSGLTPLHRAARGGHIGVVRLHLEDDRSNPDTCIIDIMDGQENTALTLAAAEGHKEVVELLLNN
jgi:ankyrin repeat protein